MTPRSWASGLRVRRRPSTLQTANRGVAVPLPGSRLGGGGGMRPGPFSAAGSKVSAGLRASVFFGGERRSLPARERRSDPGWRGSVGSFAGAGRSRAPSEHWGRCLERLRGVQAVLVGGFSRSRPSPGSASGASGGACLWAGQAACTRSRRRRTRVSVCRNQSSGNAAPQGAAGPLAVGAASPGSAPPRRGTASSSARPSLC